MGLVPSPRTATTTHHARAAHGAPQHRFCAPTCRDTIPRCGMPFHATHRAPAAPTTLRTALALDAAGSPPACYPRGRAAFARKTTCRATCAATPAPSMPHLTGYHAGYSGTVLNCAQAVLCRHTYRWVALMVASMACSPAYLYGARFASYRAACWMVLPDGRLHSYRAACLVRQFERLSGYDFRHGKQHTVALPRARPYYRYLAPPPYLDLLPVAKLLLAAWRAFMPSCWPSTTNRIHGRTYFCYVSALHTSSLLRDRTTSASRLRRRAGLAPPASPGRSTGRRITQQNISHAAAHTLCCAVQQRCMTASPSLLYTVDARHQHACLSLVLQHAVLPL